MTTTVYDRVNGKVACDSRWSSQLEQRLPQLNGYVLYVDDTGFGKLAERNDFVLVLAGSGELIEGWKKWFRQGQLIPERGLPPVQGSNGESICISLIEKSTNKVIFDHGQKMAVIQESSNEVLADFSGSGQHFAAFKWMRDSCPIAAVEFAEKLDAYTGGTVRFIDFKTGERNIEDSSSTISSVLTAMLERGFIMDTKTPGSSPVPISAQDVAHVREMIVNGQVSPCAPTGRECQDWDEQSKRELVRAMIYVRDSEARNTD